MHIYLSNEMETIIYAKDTKIKSRIKSQNIAIFKIIETVDDWVSTDCILQVEMGYASSKKTQSLSGRQGCNDEFGFRSSAFLPGSLRSRESGFQSFASSMTSVCSKVQHMSLQDQGVSTIYTQTKDLTYQKDHPWIFIVYFNLVIYFISNKLTKKNQRIKIVSIVKKSI